MESTVRPPSAAALSLDHAVNWEAISAIGQIVGYPGIQAWWRLRSHWFSEEFANHINQLQQTTKPRKLYRKTNADQ